MVMGMYGIEFDRPIGHLREYLTVLQALLADGAVSHTGDRYTVNGFLDVADAPKPPVLLGVLREQMARLAGGLADGALCWLAPAAYLSDVVAPNLVAGASAASRPTPPLIAELPCALSSDRDAVHAMAAADLGMYPRVPFYRAMFEAAGLPVTKGWSDDMLDASVIWGDEDTLAAKIQGFFDAGADEVALSPFGVGDDAAASQAECIRVLSEITKGPSGRERTKG
jgi:alkanesulfonate monooxygenase SsuD/methylene tetrahydromethanopterin reductase-like flavin-dependent oxidoreductase (luciferase family)